MSSILGNGFIRDGRVEVEDPINLPNGSKVTIIGSANGKLLDDQDTDRPMTANEIAHTLAAMSKVEPFEMTDQERATADTWDKKVNDYTIRNFGLTAGMLGYF